MKARMEAVARDLHKDAAPADVDAAGFTEEQRATLMAELVGRPDQPILISKDAYVYDERAAIEDVLDAPRQSSN